MAMRNGNHALCQEKVTGAELLIRTMTSLGIEVIFGYPGGAVLPIYDALYLAKHPQRILVRHEQAAVHAAEGYAKSSGKVGCVLVTSGPGATNAVTGLADAFMDSVPIICISGQVPRTVIGTMAFQEVDIVAVTKSCTKASFQVQKSSEISRTFVRAMEIASTGRPGPVLIDLPKDLQSEVVSMNNLIPTLPQQLERLELKCDKIDSALDLILSAQRPILYTGGGIVSAGPLATKNLMQLATLMKAPVTSTLMGLGGFPGDHSQFLGMAGMHGLVEANLAMYNCDVMVCLGVRFDDRVTGQLDKFAPKSRKIQIDIDPGSIGKNVGRIEVSIVADLGPALQALVEALKSRLKSSSMPCLDKWWSLIESWRQQHCLSFKSLDHDDILPQQALSRLSALISHYSPYVTTDVGQHQMWTAQYMSMSKTRHLITSGGLGTMGFGLPAAIGVQRAHPDHLVICVSSEWSFQMNIQELGTLAQYRLPIKIFLLNNNAMGMVQQWQDMFYEGNRAETHCEGVPDFVTLASAYGIQGRSIERPEHLDQAIIDMVKADGPFLLECKVIRDTNCFPMIPPGAPHNEMVLRD